MLKKTLSQLYNFYSLFITVLENHNCNTHKPIEIVCKNSNNEIIYVISTTYNDLYFELSSIMDEEIIFQKGNFLYASFINNKDVHVEHFVLEIM